MTKDKITTKENESRKRTRELHERERDLDERERSLSNREAYLEEWNKEIKQKERFLNYRKYREDKKSVENRIKELEKKYQGDEKFCRIIKLIRKTREELK